MKKRIACLLLALVMLVGLIPTTAIPAKAATISYSEAGVRVIKDYVGFHKNAYETFKGSNVYKIGYGTPSVAGATITEANADKLLRDELNAIVVKINNNFGASTELNIQKRMDALVWYTYIEGESWLYSQTMVNAIKGGAVGSNLVNAMCNWSFWAAGSNPFNNSDADKATILRRMRMANLYLNGTYQAHSTGSLAYTVYDAGEGSTVNGNRFSVQAFDGSVTELNPKAGDLVSGTGGKFLGWYLNGQMVNSLSGATAGQTLVARWQVDASKPVAANYTISAEIIYEASGMKDEEVIYIYDQPNGSTPINTLNRQTTVTVVAELVDSYNNKWLQLSVGGWVKLGQVSNLPTFITAYVATVTDDYVNIRQKPSATSPKVGTAQRGQQLTITMLSNDNKWGYCGQGWVFLAYTQNTSPNQPGGGTTTAGTPGNVTGAAQVNVRKGPGVSNPKVASLAQGTAVTVYEQTTVDGAPWGRIDQGWISMGYVKLRQTQQPTDGSNLGTGSSAVVNSSVRLNVRSGPGITYSVVATLAPGTSVVILRKQTVGGSTWGLIDQGWINLAYVTNSGISNPDGSSVYSVGGTVVNCSTGVNIRAAAGTTNALVGVAAVGSRVNVTEITTVNGFRWGHIERGWVCMDYIQLDSEFNAPAPTTPGGEDEPSNVVDSFQGYPARVNNPAGAQLRQTASAHAASLLTLKTGATLNILAWTQTGNSIYCKANVANQTGWVALSDLIVDTFNAKVTANRTDVYEHPSTRSKFYASLVQNTYVTIEQTADNSNWALGDGALWGKIEAVNGVDGWIKMADVTMFRNNELPVGITTYSGVGYLTGYIKSDAQMLKDHNGSPAYLEGGVIKTEEANYTLTAGTRVNLLARSSCDGREYGKVTMGSITGWIDMENVTLDPVTYQAGAEVRLYYPNTDVTNVNNACGAVPAGTRVTIIARALYYYQNEINRGVVDVGVGYINDNISDYYWIILDDGKLTPTGNATVDNPSNPVIASSVVVTGKASGELAILEEAIEGSAQLLKVASGTPVTVLNWKNVDGVTWGKVQFNKVVGWVKTAQVNFNGLTGTVAVNDLYVYHYMDKTSAVQVLRVNNKTIGIDSVQLVGTTLWGHINVDNKSGYIDLTQVNLNTPGIGTGVDTNNLPVIAKGRVNSVNATVNVDGQVIALPKSTAVDLVGLMMQNDKALWLVDLDDKDGWIDMDCLNMYSAIATVTASSLNLYNDLTLNQTLYTLYSGEQVTVQSFMVSDLDTAGNHTYVHKLYGEVAYGNTTGWILVCDNMNNMPVYLTPGSTGNTIGGTNPTTPTTPTTPTAPTTPAAEPIAAHIVCNTSVNVRSGAGVAYNLVTTLPNGTNVNIYEKAMDTTMGKEWARIDQGWVCMDYVQVGTLTVVPGGGNNGSSGSVNIITTVPDGAIAVGYANQDIKIYTGTNMGFPEVGSVKKGYSVVIYENKLVEGMSWGRTDNGWICTSYLTITGIGTPGSGTMGTIARCASTARVRYSAGSNAPHMASVRITSRVVIRETMSVGVETWARTDLGWISMEYIQLDTDTVPGTPSTPGASGTPDASTPVQTEPTTPVVDDSVG